MVGQLRRGSYSSQKMSSINGTSLVSANFKTSLGSPIINTPSLYMGHTSLDRGKSLRVSIFFYFEPKIHIFLMLPHKSQPDLYNWIGDRRRNIQLKTSLGPPAPKSGQTKFVAILGLGGQIY